jgi:hypothetical protein
MFFTKGFERERGRGNARLAEAVGEAQDSFPVAEVLKPMGFKERVNTSDVRLPHPWHKIIFCRIRKYSFIENIFIYVRT